jgi:hypothetical protein
MKPMEYFKVGVSPAMLERLKQMAASEHRSLSNLAMSILRKHITAKDVLEQTAASLRVAS